MEEIIEKYSDSVIRNFDKKNMAKIILLLEDYHCNFIDDIIEDYLDLFNIPYEEFKDKLSKLNKKYNNRFLELASLDMNYLEEFYYGDTDE